MKNFIKHFLFGCDIFWKYSNYDREQKARLRICQYCKKEQIRNTKRVWFDSPTSRFGGYWYNTLENTWRIK